MRQRINGYDFREMILSALNNIRKAEKTVNSMNVFPVADGDTGTNMRLTLENGYNKAAQTRHLGVYINDLASGMLLGARGNSGVILSQIFKGMAIELIRKGIVNPGELRNAFIRGYKTAYQAVANPVEGTMLTVAREGIENVKDMIRGSISLEDSLRLYLNAMHISLDKTPDELEVLKEANVVDSGGYGYILIVEGMYKFLAGEKVEYQQEEDIKVPVQSKPLYFDENSEFKDGYCLEFLLQLLNSKEDVKKFDINKFINKLKELGSSLVAIKEKSIVKVHIHTLNPSPVIDLAKKYGEFISFKLENMQLQHNEYSLVKQKSKKPVKELGIIAVVNGNGIENAYRDLGADVVISASGNMNASSSEFLDAIESINAKKIVLFPNNKNTFGAANQAIDISRSKDKVFIVPSKTMIEGLVALQLDLPDGNTDERILAFNSNIKLATTIGITKATKNYEKDGFCCKINDKIALINDKLVSCSNNEIECLKSALNKVENLSEKTGLVIYLGASSDIELKAQLEEYVSSLDGLDYQIIKGGQDIYDVLVGIY